MDACRVQTGFASNVEQVRHARTKTVDHGPPDPSDSAANVGAGLTVRAWGAQWLSRREREGVRSVADDRSRWRVHFEAEHGDDLLTSWTAVRARDWLSRMCAKVSSNPLHKSKKPIAGGTIKNTLNLLRRSFQDAIDDGVIAGPNPFASLRLRRSRNARTTEPWTVLTLDEQQRAILALGDLSERLLVQFAIGSGLRQSEQWALRLDDVHVDGPAPYVLVRFGLCSLEKPRGVTVAERIDRAWFVPTKSGKPRRVQLFGVALAALRQWLLILKRYAPRNPHGLVFPRPDGLPRKKGRAFRAFSRVAKAVGRSVRWHDLRHTCASSLVGGWWGPAWTLEEVRVYLGHATQAQTERYAHFAPDRLNRIAALTLEVTEGVQSMVDDRDCEELENGSELPPESGDEGRFSSVVEQRFRNPEAVSASQKTEADAPPEASEEPPSGLTWPEAFALRSAEVAALRKQIEANNARREARRGHLAIAFETVDETEEAGELLEAAKQYQRVPTVEHAGRLVNQAEAYGAAARVARETDEEGAPLQDDATARDLHGVNVLCARLRHHEASHGVALAGEAARELARFATCWWEAENRVRDLLREREEARAAAVAAMADRDDAILAARAENPSPLSETPGINFGISFGSKERMRAARDVLNAAYAYGSVPLENVTAQSHALRVAAVAYAETEAACATLRADLEEAARASSSSSSSWLALGSRVKTRMPPVECGTVREREGVSFRGMVGVEWDRGGDSWINVEAIERLGGHHHADQGSTSCDRGNDGGGRLVHAGRSPDGQRVANARAYARAVQKAGLRSESTEATPRDPYENAPRCVTCRLLTAAPDARGRCVNCRVSDEPTSREVAVGTSLHGHGRGEIGEVPPMGKRAVESPRASQGGACRTCGRGEECPGAPKWGGRCTAAAERDALPFGERATSRGLADDLPTPVGEGWTAAEMAEEAAPFPDVDERAPDMATAAAALAERDEVARVLLHARKAVRGMRSGERYGEALDELAGAVDALDRLVLR